MESRTYLVADFKIQLSYVPTLYFSKMSYNVKLFPLSTERWAVNDKVLLTIEIRVNNTLYPLSE